MRYYPNHLSAGGRPVYPSAIISSPLPFCLCSPWRPERPRSPWHCFQVHSVETLDPASRHNHLLPAPHVDRIIPHSISMCWDLTGRQAICSSSVMLLRSGSPALPNSCWVIVIFNKASSESMVAMPASAAEAAAALLASSSCRCLCSSMDTRSAWGEKNWGADNGVNSQQWHIHKQFSSFKAVISYQRQLRVCTGIHSKLKVTSAKAKHGTTLPSQNGGADEGIGKAWARGHRHQMGASPILAI
uniref:Uncharacterized protein n=1 Tax=Pelusios castaneus TaxID=367368 RepID=A0A8C8SY62_9SAUR